MEGEVWWRAEGTACEKLGFLADRPQTTQHIPNAAEPWEYTEEFWVM